MTQMRSDAESADDHSYQCDCVSSPASAARLLRRVHRAKARRPYATGSANNRNAGAYTRLFPKEWVLPGVRFEETGYQREPQRGATTKWFTNKCG